MSTIMYVLLSLIILLLIVLFVRRYNASREILTGKWYKRNKIGFVKDDIIVEFKVNHQRFTKIATKEDLEILRTKFKIEKF